MGNEAAERRLKAAALVTDKTLVEMIYEGALELERRARDLETAAAPMAISAANRSS